MTVSKLDFETDLMTVGTRVDSTVAWWVEYLVASMDGKMVGW